MRGWRDALSEEPAARAATWAVAVIAAAAVAALLVTRTDDSALVKLAVLVLGAVVVVASLDRPKLALYSVPVVAIFDRPVVILGLDVNLVVLALAVFAPTLAMRWRSGTVPAVIRWSAALLLAGGGVAAFFAPDPIAAVLGLGTWALVLNYVLGALGMIARGRRLLAGLAVEVSALGAIVAGLGWLQSRGNYTVVGPPFAADRIDSSFGYYSNYGNFVALAAVLAIGTTLALAAERRGWAAAFAGLCAVISGYGAVTSLSRGAVVCLGVGAAVIVVLGLRRLGAFAGTALVMAAAGVLAYTLAPQTLITQVVDRFTNEPGGDLTRRTLQHAGWTLLSSSPEGIGFGNFRDALAVSGIAAGRTILAHCHQLYVQIGLDFGWLGLVGFLLLALATVLYGLRTSWRAPLGYTAGFVAALAGVLAQGLNDYFFFEAASLVAFAVLLIGSLAHEPDPRMANTEPLEVEARH